MLSLKSLVLSKKILENIKNRLVEMLDFWLFYNENQTFLSHKLTKRREY
jgi:hypothetical protein